VNWPGRRHARLRHVQDLVTRTWTDVLGVDEVGLDDDFLELGGNSLHAVRIIASLEESLQEHISVRAILETRTVRTMADYLMRAG
jgi:acyl carrier protein